MCLAMNADRLEPGERCASTSNRNFEGRQGQGGRTHLVAGHGGRGGGERPFRGCEGGISHATIRKLPFGHRAADRPRQRRYRPDHPQAVPERAFIAPDSVRTCSTTGVISTAVSRGMDSSGRPLNPEFVFNHQRYRDAKILLARHNFGCGSSREHAPWASSDHGIRVLIAPSFADIFYQNASRTAYCPIRLSEANG